MKFLSNGGPISLKAVQEQFYKDPGLPAVADVSMLAEAIAAGVQDGSFGIARGTPDEIQPSSVRFEEAISQTSLGFNEEELLLPVELAQALREQLRTDATEGAARSAETGAPPADADGQRPGADGTTATDEVPPAEEDEHIEQVRLRATGVPASKIADLHRGVFMPLTREVGDFTFTIEIDLRAPDGISKRVVEQQVLETLQQLGADIDHGNAE